jgi:predicted amidophosphoribosyltransferase
MNRSLGEVLALHNLRERRMCKTCGKGNCELSYICWNCGFPLYWTRTQSLVSARERFTVEEYQYIWGNIWHLPQEYNSE